MNLKISGIFLTIMICAITSIGQTDSVDVIPYWENKETHVVKFKSSTTDSNDGEVSHFVSTFEARFTVKEATEKDYKVEWIYKNIKLADNDPVLENQLISKLTNVKLLIRLSDIGQFIELINVEEVKGIANKVVDEFIANTTTNPPMNAQFKLAKQLIASKQGLEIAILKQIKFYNFSFGYNYKINFVQTNKMKLPNPLGGQPFDALETVQLTKLDTMNSVCIIETSKIIDGKILKTAVMEYVTKATNSNPQVIEEMNKAGLEMTESTMQQIDYSVGIIQKSFFKRITNLGFLNRATLLEMETID